MLKRWRGVCSLLGITAAWEVPRWFLYRFFRLPFLDGINVIAQILPLIEGWIIATCSTQLVYSCNGETVKRFTRHDIQRHREGALVNAVRFTQCSISETTNRSTRLSLSSTSPVWSNKGFVGGVPVNTETAAVNTCGCDRKPVATVLIFLQYAVRRPGLRGGQSLQNIPQACRAIPSNNFHE